MRCSVNSGISHINNNCALSFESEAPGRNWATTHKSTVHDYLRHRRASAEPEGFQSLMVAAQVEYGR